MAPMQTFLFLLVLFFIMIANRVHSEGNTYFTINSFDSDPTDLIYQGDAHVPYGSTSLFLTKTDYRCNPKSSGVGRVLYSKPFQLWERSSARHASFSTLIHFRITSSRTGGRADGIVFFIEPVDGCIPRGSSGGNLGIFNSSGTARSIFAVEADYYVNPEWDPNYPHIGININSRESKNETRFDYLATQDNMVLYVYYDANTTTIYAEGFRWGPTMLSTVTYTIDLTTILPEQVQIGISSATEEQDVSGIYELTGWTFYSNDEPYNVIDNKDTYIY